MGNANADIGLHISSSPSPHWRRGKQPSKKSKVVKAKRAKLEARNKAVEDYCRLHPADTVGKSTAEILAMMGQ